MRGAASQVGVYHWCIYPSGLLYLHLFKVPFFPFIMAEAMSYPEMFFRVLLEFRRARLLPSEPGARDTAMEECAAILAHRFMNPTSYSNEAPRCTSCSFLSFSMIFPR